MYEKELEYLDHINKKAIKEIDLTKGLSDIK